MAINHLPNIRSVTAANSSVLADPMHASIFEVIFAIPAGLSGFTPEEIGILTEQVTSVSGLDALQKTPAAGQQKFLGADFSYLNPTLDNTYAEITIELNLNLRNATDAYVFRVFKAWQKLNYDLATGTRVLMKDYTADFLTIKEANRDGTVWRKVDFRKVMMTSCTGLDALDYTNNEARKLTVVFRTDLWDETIEGGIAGA
jgi:hypothetical protein